MKFPLRELDYIVTMSFGYILYCVCFNLYSDGFKFFVMCVCVCVCVCVGFAMCGCPDNVYTLKIFGYPDWGFSLLFLICKANARVKLAKTGHGQHSSTFIVCAVLFVIRIVLLLIVLLYILFVCKCVLYCTTATGWLPNCSWQIYQNLLVLCNKSWYLEHSTAV
jgi:hypothetical protein